MKEHSEKAVYAEAARSRKRILLYALPLALLGALCACYAISPDFYLEYVLHVRRREFQAVEIVTFASALIGGVSCAAAAILLLRRSRFSLGFGSSTAAAAIISVIALAALFFAGEEISWGQHYFGWETPEGYESVETNLHNWDGMIFNVQTAGSVFLIAVFIVLPAWWALRRQFPLPRLWRPAIAEGPVAFAVLAAFLWKETKNVYKLFVDVGERPPDPAIYWQFIEQFNEHKEMLVAVALLMYGLYRLRAVRSISPEG